MLLHFDLYQLYMCCSVAQLLQYTALALRADGQGSQLHIEVFSLLSADDSFIHTYVCAVTF